jgi:hypothetical protein
MSFLRELIDYLLTRKKLWMIPLMILFMLVGAIFVLGQGSVVAPFIYTLF